MNADKEEFKCVNPESTPTFEDVFQAFVNGRFTKSRLRKLCKEKGVDIEVKKENFVAKVMELYSPEELAEASAIMRLLR